MLKSINGHIYLYTSGNSGIIENLSENEVFLDTIKKSIIQSCSYIKDLTIRSTFNYIEFVPIYRDTYFDIIDTNVNALIASYLILDDCDNFINIINTKEQTFWIELIKQKYPEYYRSTFNTSSTSHKYNWKNIYKYFEHVQLFSHDMGILSLSDLDAVKYILETKVINLTGSDFHDLLDSLYKHSKERYIDPYEDTLVIISLMLKNYPEMIIYYRSCLLHNWILENHAFLGNEILDLVIEIENTGFSPMLDFDFIDHMKRYYWDYINADIFGRIYMRYLRELEIFQYFPKTTNVELLKVILKLAKLSHSDIIGLLRNNYFIMTPEVKKLLIDKYDPYDAPLSFFNIRREIDNVKNDKIEGWCTVD